MRNFWTIVIGFASLVTLATLSSDLPSFGLSGLGILFAGLIAAVSASRETKSNLVSKSLAVAALLTLLAVVLWAFGYSWALGILFATVLFVVMLPVSLSTAKSMYEQDRDERNLVRNF